MNDLGILPLFPKGKITLRAMYELLFFLDTGMKIPYSIKRVPTKSKKKILEKYHLVYDKSKKQYIGNEDEIFNTIKKEFPETINKYNITDWWKLIDVYEKIAGGINI